MLSTSGEFIEDLDLYVENEVDSEEARGEKARIYKEFDDSTKSESYIEILRFKHFARYMSFVPTGKQGKKKQIMSGIEVSVVLHVV